MTSGTEEEIIEDVPSPMQVTISNCKKILSAALWLISNGWGKIQILPYAAPSGCYWRCELHPPGQPRHPFFRYSTGAGHQFLADHCGGSVRKNISDKALAEAIMVSVPEYVKEQCKGPVSFETLLWSLELIELLDRGVIPQAFDEMTTDYSTWTLFGLHGAQGTMRPQPGYIPPGRDLIWFLSPEWAESVRYADDLAREDEFLMSFSNEEQIRQVADALVKVVLAEQNDLDAPKLLKAAIASLARQ